MHIKLSRWFLFIVKFERLDSPKPFCCREKTKAEKFIKCPNYIQLVYAACNDTVLSSNPRRFSDVQMSSTQNWFPGRRWTVKVYWLTYCSGSPRQEEPSPCIQSLSLVDGEQGNCAETWYPGASNSPYELCSVLTFLTFSFQSWRVFLKNYIFKTMGQKSLSRSDL